MRLRICPLLPSSLPRMWFITSVTWWQRFYFSSSEIYLVHRLILTFRSCLGSLNMTFILWFGGDINCQVLYRIQCQCQVFSESTNGKYPASRVQYKGLVSGVQCPWCNVYKPLWSVQGFSVNGQVNCGWFLSSSAKRPVLNVLEQMSSVLGPVSSVQDPKSSFQCQGFIVTNIQ